MPKTNLKALGKAGAGSLGNYSYCSFSVTGTGRFKPNDQAHPYPAIDVYPLIEEQEL